MDGMFSCDEDNVNLAEFCCACTYPLPCICAQCKDTHCSKPRAHHILPLSAKAEITSEKDLTRVQYRLHQLDLTYKDLWGVFGTFQKLREDVEATYQELTQQLTEARNRHIGQINAAAELYEQRVNQAMQESYSNACKGRDFLPSDSFEALIWTHEPGDGTDFDLLYQVYGEKETVGEGFQVSWMLPFPGFSPCPEDAFPIKLVLDSGEIRTLLVRPGEILSDIRAKIQRKCGLLPQEAYFWGEIGELQSDWNVKDCYLTHNSALHFTSKITINVTTASWIVERVEIDLNSTISDCLVSLSHDFQSSTMQEFLLFREKWLSGTSLVAECGLGNEAEVRVVRKVLVPFTLSIYLPCDQIQTIYIESSDLSIYGLKDRINQLNGLQSEQYSLTYMGQELVNQWALAYYSLQEGSNAALVPIETGEIEVAVWQSSGKPLILSVNKWETVGNVILRLREKAINAPRLYLNREKLQESRFIVSYNVQNQALLQPFDMIIQVKDEFGNILALNVEKTDLIEALKGQIEQKTRISADLQDLIYTNQVLESGQSLSFYHIQHEACLCLVWKWSQDSRQIYIKPEKGEIVTLCVKGSDLIGEIKGKIQSKERIPIEKQRLVYKRKELANSKRLADYQIQEQAFLRLEEQTKALTSSEERRSMQIYVKTALKTASLNADSRDTIQELKDRVTGKEDWQAQEQRLVYRGKAVEEGRTMGDYGIQTGATLYLALATLIHPLYVRTESGATLVLDASRTDFIDRIMAKIAEEIAISPALYSLVLNNLRLEDDGRTLGDFTIQPGATVDLVLRRPYVIHIQSAGKRYSLEIEEYDPVSRLKAKVAEMSAVSPVYQQLFKGEVELESGKTMGSYEIGPDSVLKLSLKA